MRFLNENMREREKMIVLVVLFEGTKGGGREKENVRE
jgi:hypothetical protein